VSGGVQEDVENLFPLFGRLQAFFVDPCFKQVRFNLTPQF